MSTSATAVFENVETYRQWDKDYYSGPALAYYDRAIRQMIELLAPAPDETVLDAGTGPGVHAIRVAGLGHRVHGIDISGAALAEARRRIAEAGVSDRVTLEQADLTALPYADASYRCVFSWGVVIHIPPVEKALSELARILAPGGRLALYIINASALDHRLLACSRALLHRRRPTFEQGRLGSGCWYGVGEDRLWVWRLDTRAVVDCMQAHGLVLRDRRPGTLTELHRRVPWPVSSLLLHANNGYHRLGLSARPCITHLLVFEKPAGGVPAMERSSSCPA